MDTLHDVMRRYPGGIAALASRVGVSRQALYLLARGEHASEPTELLQAIRDALLEASSVPTQRELAKMWRAAREAAQ